MFARSTCWSAFLALLSLISLCHQVEAANSSVMWVLTHGRMMTSRIDPIVSPGMPSSHVHNFVGMNGIDENTVTVEQLDEQSTCTTAGLTDDKSSYWAPQLYNINDNGTFSPFSLQVVNTYYLMRGSINVKSFPMGLKMVAGNAKATGPAATQQLQGAVSFVCLNYDTGSSQAGSFPQGKCPQGLRTQVTFPSCWDGQSLYQKDMSHVVYPTGNFADNGPCPDSHAIRLPTLFYEYIWNTGATDNTGNQSWVLANGDAFGYSFHADFFANWNETTMQDAIDNCTGNLFNNLEACPPLARTLDRKASSACKGVSTEPLSGAFASLPGCNIVYNGPHAGEGLAPGCDPSLLPNLPAGAKNQAASVSARKSTSATSTRTTSAKKHRKTTSSKKKTHHKTTTSNDLRVLGAKTTSHKKPRSTSTKKHHTTSTKKKHSTTSTAKKHRATRRSMDQQH